MSSWSALWLEGHLKRLQERESMDDVDALVDEIEYMEVDDFVIEELFNVEEGPLDLSLPSITTWEKVKVDWETWYEIVTDDDLAETFEEVEKTVFSEPVWGTVSNK